MPPHLLNYCQLFNVSCFSLLKNAYGDLVQTQMWQDFNYVDKLGFIEVYPEAQKKAFSIKAIKSGFRATSLIPFNPEKVLR